MCAGVSFIFRLCILGDDTIDVRLCTLASSLKNAFACTMVGYLANSAVPRLGEILKCTFLGRYEKIPADKLIGTILVERAFDLFCYAIFIAITVSAPYDLPTA